MFVRHYDTRFLGITFNTEMWKEFKRMAKEAAAETVDNQVQKELVVKVWGKLVSQFIGEMKNGFLVEAGHQRKQSTRRKWKTVGNRSSRDRVAQLSTRETQLQNTQSEPILIQTIVPDIT